MTDFVEHQAEHHGADVTATTTTAAVPAFQLTVLKPTHKVENADEKYTKGPEWNPTPAGKGSLFCDADMSKKLEHD